jgi:hypothetical protein
MAIRFNCTSGMHSRTRKLDEKDILYIRSQRGKSTTRQLATRFGIHMNTVLKIWKRQSWSSLPERK